jgi:phytoene synthase
VSTATEGAGRLPLPEPAPVSGRATASLGCDPADIAAVDAIVRAAGTSFTRGMRILPVDRRTAMHAIYAFCRQVDDIADDDDGTLADRIEGLEAWRARVRDLFAGRATDALTRVLLAAIRRYHLRQADFEAVIDGMRTDAEQHVVAPDLAALDLYCDQVASAVGRLSVRAFGDSSAEADIVAFHLGRALQLTNILRDLDEDAGRGRLYLPREWLDEASIPLEPEPALSHPALPSIAARMAAEANRHFAAAHAAMALCDRRAMRPARLMGATYAAILRRLVRRGWQGSEWRRPEARVRLPTWQKLALAARAMLTG